MWMNKGRKGAQSPTCFHFSPPCNSPPPVPLLRTLRLLRPQYEFMICHLPPSHIFVFLSLFLSSLCISFFWSSLPSLFHIFPFSLLGNPFFIIIYKRDHKKWKLEKKKFFCDCLGSHSLLESCKQLRCTSLGFFRVVTLSESLKHFSGIG